MCERQLLYVAIQAAIGGRIIARETVKALCKDMLAKCYGARCLEFWSGTLHRAFSFWVYSPATAKLATFGTASIGRSGRIQ